MKDKPRDHLFLYLLLSCYLYKGKERSERETGSVIPFYATALKISVLIVESLITFHLPFHRDIMLTAKNQLSKGIEIISRRSNRASTKP